MEADISRTYVIIIDIIKSFLLDELNFILVGSVLKIATLDLEL